MHHPRSSKAAPWRPVVVAPSRRLLAGLLVGLVGGALAIVGLALALDVVSLRGLVAARQVPLADLVIALRGRLGDNRAHGLENLAGAAGLVLLAAGCLLAGVNALRRRPATLAGRVARLAIAIGGGLLALPLLLLALHLTGVWGNGPGSGLLEDLAVGSLQWLRAVLRRAA